MTLSFCSFSSGSSGNCYLVKTETTAILVDAGISCRKITDGLKKTSTPEELLKAILVTHEHVDHVSGVKTTLKKYKHISVCANELTFSQMKYDIKEDRKNSFASGESFIIGDLEVETFSVSHDAVDPVGYNIKHEGKQISIVTDTGCIEDENMSKIEEADILVIEANHDVNMLKYGHYPSFLKQRVLGSTGHLSNEAAGECIAKIMKTKEKARCILLAHLSKDNNYPEMAEQTVCNILEQHNWQNGRDVYIKSINRDEISMIYEI